MTRTASNFVVTTQYQRFAEFCDACRDCGYIGLCYGAAGVGKTLSARYYANWDQVGAYSPYNSISEAHLAAVQGSDTIFYTPKVVNTPKQIEQDIDEWRYRLRMIPVKELRYEAEGALQVARMPDDPQLLIEAFNTLEEPPSKRPRKLSLKVRRVAQRYMEQLQERSEPTTLVIIDEADRLKTAGLEQVRDIFDQSGIGFVLIGMPGLEKRLSRYPQLYSRVGFVHEFRPLSAKGVRDLFQRQWVPTGVDLPEKGLNDDDVVAAIIRITGGNFRLLHRLITQSARLVQINALSKVTQDVVEAAREALVIGTA